MNERIKQLGRQANAYISEPNDWGMIDFDTSKINLEKFAELIIRECIQVSEAHAKYLESQPTDSLLESYEDLICFEAYEDGIVNGIYEATETIKQHFGVEL